MNPNKKILVLPFLATGIALIAHVLLDVNILIGLSIIVFLIFGATYSVYRNLSPQTQKQITETIKLGFTYGVLATILYDLSRLLIVSIFELKVNPFEAFKYFGFGIAGEQISDRLAFILGTSFHFLNGVFFSIAYFILFYGKKFYWGIIWAFFLELLMLLLYPIWLDINNLIYEFTIVSVSGHICYGATIGYFNQRKSQLWKI